MPINSNTINTRNAPSAPAGTTLSNTTNVPSAPATRSTAGTNNPSKRPISSIVNPCTFLNTYYQVIKTQFPPNYKFSIIKRPKGYVAELNYLDKSWKSNTKSNKKEAKEEVATLCAEFIESKHSYNFSRVMRVLERVGSQKTRIAKNMRLIDQTPEVVKWYNTERMRTPPKPMRVLLLELCQKYGFSKPRFYQKSGPNNKLTYITCKVNQKSWEPDTGFSKRFDAKDHVATHAFNSLFLEIQTREEEEIKKENGLIKDQCAQLKRRKETKYIILLHDAAKKKHWPVNYEYRFRNGYSGIVAHVHLGEKVSMGHLKFQKMLLRKTTHIEKNSDEIIIYQETSAFVSNSDYNLRPLNARKY